jgi:putative hydrolase of the HAD superfamily
MHAQNDEILSWNGSEGMPNGIRAVLCDVGGVLIHKRRSPDLQRWEPRFASSSLGLPLAIWLCESSQRAMVGQASVEDVWREIQQTHGLTDAELLAFRNDFEGGDYLDEAFVQFLQQMRQTRKIALLSNAWPDARHSFGNIFGLAKVADMMILSCEEGLVKPDPRLYALAAERLQLPHVSIVFIDDYPPHVAAAQTCGMHGVVFETHEQAIADLQALLHG